MKKLAAAFAVLAFLQSCSAYFEVFRFGQPSYLQQADEFSRQGKYGEAIDAYRSHMEERLAVKNRPDWENPYFYLVLIGDIQLGQGRPEEALASYDEADRQGVDAYLISDRYRSVAAWYEKEGRLEEAIELLSRHRQRDPILIDSMLDRMSKELVRTEEAKHTSP